MSTMWKFGFAIVVVCLACLGVNGFNDGKKDYRGLPCTSGSILTTDNCGFGTKCSHSGKCVEALDQAHPWLRDPIDQGACAASQVMAMVAALDDRRSAYGAVEGAKLSSHQQTSVQYFLNCMPEAKMLCDGGVSLSRVHQQIMEGKQLNRLLTEIQLPFTGKIKPQSGCRTTGNVNDLRVVNLNLEYTGTKDKLAEHIQTYGPTVVIVKAGPEMFTYTHGQQGKSRRTDMLMAGYHAVVVVGKSSDEFIIKNSWGRDWGNNGYMRIERNHFLKHYLVTGQIAGERFPVHMVFQDVSRTMERITEKYTHVEKSARGEQNLGQFLQRRYHRFRATNERFDRPNEFHVSQSLEEVVLAKPDGPRDLPKLKLAVLAAMKDLNEHKASTEGKKYKFKVDQIIHADVSVAAGRLFFLVLQVAKFKQQSSDSDAPEAIECYATKVWLPFKKYRSTEGSLPRIYVEYRVSDEDDVMYDAYGGAYAFYKVVPIEGDKPFRFSLTKNGYITGEKPGGTEYSVGDFVRFLFAAAFSTAVYGGAGVGVLASNASAKFYMQGGLVALGIFVALFITEAQKYSSRGLLELLLLSVGGSAYRFALLPFNAVVSAYSKTTKLALLSTGTLGLLATWLAIDGDARAFVLEYLAVNAMYEKQEGAQDRELNLPLPGWLLRGRAQRGERRQRGLALMVQQLREGGERDAVEDEQVHEDYDDRIGR